MSRGIDTISSEELELLYSSILDHLSIPSHVKENLIKTESKEKKYQLVQLHENVLQDVQSMATITFGDKDRLLLDGIKKSKQPDIKSLTLLKTILTTANQPYIDAFFEYGGANILVKCIEDRLHRRPMTTLDAALLYEIISCVRSIMNNAIGMEGMISHAKAIERISEALNFQYKPLALQVLEILSVCCYYSERSTALAINGMRRLAKTRQEPVFHCLIEAITYQDVQVRAAVMQFINNLIMGLNDVRQRISLRTELSSRLLGETINESLREVESDMRLLPLHMSNNTLSSLVSMHGLKAVDAVTLVAAATASTSTTNNAANAAVSYNVGVGANRIKVTPSKGIMAGVCIAAKNTESLQTKVVELFGGKRTKRRWYELDGDEFKWCFRNERTDFKGFVSMSTVVDIRYNSTDINVNASSKFTFEVETVDRIFSLGCETIEEKDNWLLALQVARDAAIMKKCSYKLVTEQLYPSDLDLHYRMFEKQVTLYTSLYIEDKSTMIDANGLDISDYHTVSTYLHHELVAQGLEGKLVSIFHEFLLMPPNADELWMNIADYLKELRCQGSFMSDEDCDDSPTALLNKKSTALGVGYSQVSKLALSVMTKDAEIVYLKDKIKNGSGSGDTLKGRWNGRGYNDNDDDASLDMLTFIDDETLPSPPLPSHVSVDNTTTAPVATTTGVTDTNLAISSVYEKYTKMFKMKVPEAAIRLKMSVDNINQDKIDSFISSMLQQQQGVSLPPPSSSSSSSVLPTLPPATVTSTAIAIADDPKYAKYVKMKAMNIPEGAIRQKMISDGLPKADIDIYFASSASTTTTAVVKVDELTVPVGMTSKPALTPKNKMKAVFWNKIKPIDVEGTIWYNTYDDDIYSLSEEEKESLEVLFSNSTLQSKRPSTANTDKPKAVALFDGKRTQNVLIGLGNIRKDVKEIHSMICQWNSATLSLDVTKILLTICPTTEEVDVAMAHPNREELDPVGQFFVEVADIVRCRERLECYELTLTLLDDVRTCKCKVDILNNACNELEKSMISIQKLFQLILNIGNYLNGGTTRGQAYGFTLDTLSMLPNVKSADGSGTLVNYLALKVERKFPEVLLLIPTLTSVFAACDVSLTQIDADIKALLASVKKLKSECDILGNSSTSSSSSSVNMIKCINDFMSVSESKIGAVVSSRDSCKKHLNSIMIKYGDKNASKGTSEAPSSDEGDGNDIGKQFFHTISSFFRQLQQAYDDNRRRKMEEETKQKNAVEAEKRKADRIRRVSTLGAQAMDTANAVKCSQNIFGDFHSREEAAPEELMAEFKRKLLKGNLLSKPTDATATATPTATTAATTAVAIDNTATSSLSPPPKVMRPKHHKPPPPLIA